MSDKLVGKKKRTRSQVGRGSRNKGKVFERAVSKMLTARGIPARRAVQFDGTFDYDIKVELPVNFECKNVQNLNIHKAMIQSRADAKKNGDLPVVVHKKNNAPMLLTMDFTDFIDLLQWGLGYVDEQNTLDLKDFRERWTEKFLSEEEADRLL